MHVVRILVQGIGDYAALGEPEDCARFHESIQKVSDALAQEITPEDLLVNSGAVVKALEDHHRLVRRRQGMQNSELQHIVRMLTSTVGIISGASQASINRLGEIEKQVLSAAELDDVLVIKGRLSDCLFDIRNEVERQKTRTAEILEQVNQGLGDPAAISPNETEPAPDAVTGLPQRHAAEAALSHASQSGGRSYAAVLVLDRLQALNARFGRSVGDEVLVAFSSMVKKKLSVEDQLFRWSGPTLLAVLQRRGTIEGVRAEIARVVEAKMEHTIETGSRSILIPIGARWAVFPMMAAPRLLHHRIDTFTAVLSTRD